MYNLIYHCKKYFTIEILTSELFTLKQCILKTYNRLLSLQKKNIPIEHKNQLIYQSNTSNNHNWLTFLAIFAFCHSLMSWSSPEWSFYEENHFQSELVFYIRHRPLLRLSKLHVSEPIGNGIPEFASNFWDVRWSKRVCFKRKLWWIPNEFLFLLGCTKKAIYLIDTELSWVNLIQFMKEILMTFSDFM